MENEGRSTLEVEEGSRLSSASHGPESTQVLEGVEAGGVAVGPDGLEGVGTDRFQAEQLRRAGGQRTVRSFVQVSHDIGLAGATGTGAMTAQGDQGDETLGAIIPAEGEFGADDLDVDGAHTVVVRTSEEASREAWKHNSGGAEGDGAQEGRRWCGFYKTPALRLPARGTNPMPECRGVECTGSIDY